MSTEDQAPPYLHLEVAAFSPVAKVIDAESALHKLARGVASQFGEPVQWMMVDASTNGVIRFRLTPQAVSERTAESTLYGIVHAVVDGVVKLSDVAERPDFYNDDALEAVAELAELRNDIGTVSIMNGSAGGTIDERFHQNVDRLIGAQYEDYGSVEGRIEGVNLHVNRYFSLYDDLTGRRIRCNFAHRVAVEAVKEALEMRASVWGLIARRADGTPIRVAVEGLRVFRPDAELPTLVDVFGILNRVPGE